LLERHDSLIILGGFVRRALNENAESLSEDRLIDLDVVGFFGKGWRERMADVPGVIARTPLGGVRIRPEPGFLSGIKWVDVWDVRDNINIRLFHLKPTIENVILGGPLNLDRIGFDVSAKSVLDGGCLIGLQKQRVVYDPIWEYLPHIQLFRGVSLCERLLYEPDASLFKLARNVNWRESRPAIREYFADNGYDDTSLRRCEEILLTWVRGRG
jgi:hypothetical protein